MEVAGRMVTGQEDCGQCGHEFDAHAIVATGPNPVDGGIVLCPVPGCECFSTWGVYHDRPLLVPSSGEVARMRAEIQSAP